MVIELKKCKKCNEIYPNTTEYFFRNKKMKDGLLSSCKSCQTKATTKWRKNNKDKIRKYRQSEVYKKYRQSEEFKESQRISRRKYRQGKSIPKIMVNGKFKVLSRYLMEREIGRDLLPTEIVHHIDENPFNNTIENLQLCKNKLEHMKIHRKMRNKIILLKFK